MTNPNFADEEEKPLDPAMEKVRRKMVRLLIISSSVIIIGLMAVVFSIVYRVNNNSARTAATAADAALMPPATQSFTVPAGFTIQSTIMDGNRILITGVNANGSRRLIVHDFVLGKTITEIAIEQK